MQLKLSTPGKFILAFLILLSGLFVPQDSRAADNYLSGSRFSGMANASVMVPDIWSIAHNQAGLAFINSTAFSLHYENEFMVPQYGLKSVALVLPTSPGTMGFSFYYFGYTKYHEMKSSLSFGRMLTKNLSAGIAINHHSIYQSADFGRSSTISFEAGLMFKPIDDLYIGTHIFNPTHSGFKSPEGDELLPLVFRLGAGYTFMDMLMVNIETEKRDDQQAIWKLGAELEAIQNLYLRAGLASRPMFNTIGMGYKAGGLKGDIAFSFHPQLGFTPHFTLSYCFN